MCKISLPRMPWVTARLLYLHFSLHLILRIGDSETVLRLIPWLGGAIAIPAIYFLARQFLEKTPSYIVSFVVAISVTQIQYSQQLREYSLTFVFAISIFIFFFRQFRNPSWNNLVFMTLSMIFGVFLQYGLALLIIALNIVCVIELLSAKDNRKLLFLEWVISQFIVLCAVVLVYFLSLMIDGSRFWVILHIWIFIRCILEWFVSHFSALPYPIHMIFLVSPTLILFFFLSLQSAFLSYYETSTIIQP